MRFPCISESTDSLTLASSKTDEFSDSRSSVAQETDAASQTLQGLLTPGLRSIQRTPSQPYQLALADVLGADGDGFFAVNIQSGQRLRLMVAVSCMVMPERGDLVQVFANRTGGWITMVLRRAKEDTPITLTAGDRDLQIQASAVSLKATNRVDVQAPRLCQRATLMETTANERTSLISGSDTLQAGMADWNVEGHMGLHAKTQLITADGLMKINGSQIHMA